jgi:hypothetical protein
LPTLFVVVSSLKQGCRFAAVHGTVPKIEFAHSPYMLVAFFDIEVRRQ